MSRFALHLLTQSRNVTPRQVFAQYPQVKKQLWGGELWTDGYFASTVGKQGNEDMISAYVKNQGQTYQQLHHNNQLSLF